MKICEHFQNPAWRLACALDFLAGTHITYTGMGTRTLLHCLSTTNLGCCPASFTYSSYILAVIYHSTREVISQRRCWIICSSYQPTYRPHCCINMLSPGHMQRTLSTLHCCSHQEGGYLAFKSPKSSTSGCLLF